MSVAMASLLSKIGLYCNSGAVEKHSSGRAAAASFTFSSPQDTLHLSSSSFVSNNRWRSFTSPNPNGSPPSVPQSRGPVILELPLDIIRRPLMRTRANDPQKVKELMESISEIGLQVPIDVLEVDGEYYGFSGCHRFEAHQKLGLPTIRCKVRRGTKETLRHHLR